MFKFIKANFMQKKSLRIKTEGLKNFLHINNKKQELYLISDLVGTRGFEPPASWTRTMRASQTALRPV